MTTAATTGAAAPIDFHTKSISLDWSTEYMANTTNQALWFANDWRISYWHKDDISWATNATPFAIQDSWGNTNRIGITRLSQKLRIQLYNSSAGLFKNWTTSNNVYTDDTIHNTEISWDWTNLKLWVDDVEITSFSKATNNSWTMTDSNRIIIIGWSNWPTASYLWLFSRLDIWSANLNTEESWIYDSWDWFKLDLRSSNWDYTSTEYLVHQYPLWKDDTSATTIWEDYISSWNVNIGTNAANIDASDVVDFI